MKKLLLSLVFMFVACLYGWATAEVTTIVVGQPTAVAPPTEDEPNEWGARCDDNAANTTIVAWVGSNGTYQGANTSTQTTTDHYEGTRAFAPTSTYGPTAPQLASSGFGDGNFTLQWAHKATNSFAGSDQYIRFVDFIDTTGSPDYSEDFMVYANNSDTQITVYWNGVWNNIAVNDLSNGAWQVIRIVIDTSQTHKISVYQGATEATLELVGYDDAVADFAFNTNFTPLFCTDGANGLKSCSQNGTLIDDLKIWNTAVTP